MKRKFLQFFIMFTVLSLSFWFIYVINQAVLYGQSTVYIIAAFGAAAVLLFANNIQMPSFKCALIGSLTAAITGVVVSFFITDFLVASMLGITLSIGIMNFFNSPYPPGGAIALVPILGGDQTQKLGFMYLLFPVLTGIVTLYIMVFFYKKIIQKL